MVLAPARFSAALRVHRRHLFMIVFGIVGVRGLSFTGKMGILEKPIADGVA